MTNPYDPPSGYYPPGADPGAAGGATPPPPYGPPPPFGTAPGPGTIPGFGGTPPPNRGGLGGRLPGVGRPWRRRHTLGCFGSLVAVALLVVVLQVAVTPWAFHIGGRFSLSMSWSGVATARSPGGEPYAVRLYIAANTLGKHACSQFGCDDVHGTVTVCTAAGEYSFTNVSGQVGGWLSTDGQQMTIEFSHGSVVSDKGLQGTLRGTWHGKVYQASDGGYLDRDFASNGTPRTEVTSPDAKDAVALPFQPGDFTAACDSVRHS